MPTYEYECTRCGAVTEVFQPITDKPRRKLKASDEPKCNCDATVTRLIGIGGGIIFKGSGFYQTDYRSENYKKAAEADKPKSDAKDKGADKAKVPDKKVAKKESKGASSTKPAD